MRKLMEYDDYTNTMDCPICHEQLSPGYGLNQHILVHHDAYTGNATVCPYCKAEFPFGGGLFRHHINTSECFEEARLMHDLKRAGAISNTQGPAFD